MTPGGEQFWYSPLHRLAMWEVPAAPWGGFLAEEMVSIWICSTSTIIAVPFLWSASLKVSHLMKVRGMLAPGLCRVEEWYH